MADEFVPLGDWQEVRLGALGEVNRGRSRHRPRNAPHLYGGPYPFIQTGDIKASDGRITAHTQTYTEAGLQQSRLWPPNTMVITIAANIAETALLTYPACFPDSVVGFIADKSLCDVRFVEYMFRLLRRQLQHENIGTGSVQDNINLETLNRLRFSAPPLPEQRAIAHILGVLDDKIEVNRRMNATLDAMARALFKDWFVDFGPTRAKMAGRKPYLASKIWNLFPNTLDNDGKPEGWKTYMLGDLVNHHRATISPAAEPESTFEHYSIPAYDAGNEPTLDSGESIKSNKTIVPEGVVLLSKLNPEIERVWLPNPKGELPQVSSTEFLAFAPLAPATLSVLFCIFKSEGFRAEMGAMVTGTSKSHQRVSPKALLFHDVLVADTRLLDSLDSMVRPLLNRLLANRHESHTLAQTRNLLLPKLMSGEIRLREVEKTVQAVT